jgi:Flp pilus assembly protein TadG
MKGVHIRRHVGSSPANQNPVRRGARQVLALARGESGQSLVEFALITPLLFTILLGVIKFGVTFNNYLSLTNATNIAAQAVSISRGQTTDPCKTVGTAFYQAAPFLTPASLSFTITLNGNAEVTSAAGGTGLPSCSTKSGDLVAAKTATVNVTYPCNLSIYSVNFAPSCKLTAQTSEAIQ